MKKLIALAALVLIAAAPRLASASSMYSTFTDRAAYQAAIAGQGATPTTVDLGAIGVTAGDIGPATVATGGACTFGPALFGSTPDIFLAFGGDGSCVSSLTFTLDVTSPPITGFGFDFGSLDMLDPTVPSGITATVSPTFNGNADLSVGSDPQVYTDVPTFEAGSRFFGVVLSPGGSAGEATQVGSVAVTLDDVPATIGITNVEYATFAPESTVPEPATFVLVGGGLAIVGAVARRRRAVA